MRIIDAFAGRVDALRHGAATGGRSRIRSRLAIEALPDAFTSLETACLYAVHVDASPARDALVFDTARNSRAKAVTVLLNRGAEPVAAALRGRGFSGRGSGIWPRRLNVLVSPPPEPDVSIDSSAVPPLARLIGGLRSLKRFGLKSGALYIVEGAEDWFSWHSAASLAQEAAYLANWCKTRRCAMVLLLNYHRQGDGQARPDAHGADAFNGDAEGGIGISLRGFYNAFTGVAHLSQSLGEMVWLAKFWRVRKSMVTARSHALRFTQDGALAVALSVREVGASALLTRDAHRVLATRAAVEGESWIPPEWEIAVENKAMIAACQSARGVTVLLDYSAVDDLDALCQVIHGLRGSCGRAIKIAVRERGVLMRHQYELLALSLGANMVIGRAVSFSRLLCLLESVQGQLSTRPIIKDYRTALSAALSDSVRGYLNMTLFCDQIERVIERGQVLHLPHVLLKLQLRPDVSHLEALRACVLRRAGDICSVDHDFLYLFLFACPVSDSDVALQRIFAGQS
jgi:cellulose biosynthesis protein BcsE